MKTISYIELDRLNKLLQDIAHEQEITRINKLLEDNKLQTKDNLTDIVLHKFSLNVKKRVFLILNLK
jgi:hypothetical protein